MSVKTSWLALLCGIALSLPAAAQEEPTPQAPPPEDKPAAKAPAKPRESDPELHRWGGWTLALSAWNPSLIGAEEEVALTTSNGVLSPLFQGADARIRETMRATYHLPKDNGSIMAQYEGMYNDDTLQYFTPGQFGIVESRAYPQYLGVFDDGTADGVESHALRKTRDFRLEYQRQAFDTKWARATWGAGYRELSQQRSVGITYHAIVPNLPPTIPPAVPGSADPLRLAPLPDGVTQDASFTGHGLGASFDVEFPVHRIVSIVSGISVGLVRGKSKNAFTSTSSYYARTNDPDTPLTFEELSDILANGTEEEIQGVDQISVTTSLSTTSESELAESYDIYVGVQVLAYKGLRVFATLRDVSYRHVGEYVVPRPDGTTETTSLDAGYEGYTVGLSYRF